MPRYDAASRCSGPDTPTFRWYGFPPCTLGEDVSTAVNALFAAISGRGRVWNPYAKQMARSEFKRRIQKAERGHLRPVDEVKAVDVRNPPPLYEIRWQGIKVTSIDGGSTQTFGDAVVRMYHSEPISAPGHFVGHHVHEKILDSIDINGDQQLEIQTAVGWHKHGVSANWGIA